MTGTIFLPAWVFAVAAETQRVVMLGDHVEGVVAAWGSASTEERRDMLRMMLEAVYVDVANGMITCLKPKPNFLPLFRLDEAVETTAGVLVAGDPDGIRGRGFKHFRLLGLYPVHEAVAAKLPHKIPSSLWPELVEESRTRTLRELADAHGVSYEAVRKTLVRANRGVTTKER